MLLWPARREMCSIVTSASESTETKLCQLGRRPLWEIQPGRLQ
jgi:hypothetical protein